MRTITTTVYKFDELSDTAKNKARDWWRNLDGEDPAWHSEHMLSRNAAIVHRYDANAVQDSANCVWTGYRDDKILADHWDGTGETPSVRAICGWYADAWEKEIDSCMADGYVEEQILANDYEFTVDGYKY